MAKTKKFTCYICHNTSIDLEKNICYAHESLHVSICERCRGNHVLNDKWHTGDEWQDFDERGKCIYCEVCGEGGTLMCCDNKSCSHSFCLPCLEAWLGKKTLDDFLADDKLHFGCFVCTYKEGASGLEKKYAVYSRFIKESEKFFDENSMIIRKDPKKEKSDKEKRKSQASSNNNHNSSSSTTPSKCTFTCFSCFKRIEYSKNFMPKLHNEFKVAMCKPCYDYLQADDWTFTDGKSDFCVITGDGGEIISCDAKNCTHSFDVATLKKWMDKAAVAELLENEDDEFKCFKCDPKLGNYQKFLKQTEEYMSVFKKAKQDKEAKESKDRDDNKENRSKEDYSLSPNKKRAREETNGNSISPKNKSSKRNVSETDARRHLYSVLKGVDSCYKDTEIYRKTMKILK